jgi:hypothetical protein
MRDLPFHDHPALESYVCDIDGFALSEWFDE